MKKIKVMNIGYIILSMIVLISVVMTYTISALQATKYATGVITFSSLYNLTITKDGTGEEISSSNITIKKNLTTANVVAKIDLTVNEGETYTTINNGSIEGNFYKYDWGIKSESGAINFDSESLVYGVYASSEYEYYPMLTAKLKYEGQGYEEAHISINTEQNAVYSIIDPTGVYYSYIVDTTEYKYLVTYPRLSEEENGYETREVKIIIIGNNGEPQKFIGTGIENKQYELRLNDIINGVYIDSAHVSQVELEVTFDLLTEFVI